MTKKFVFWISGIIVAILLLSNWIGTYNLCGKYSIGECPLILYSIIIEFIIFFPIFLFSLITYKMRNEIFHAWTKFTYVWLPLTLILVFIAPEYQNSWLPIYEKSFVSFVMSSVYVLISVILIIARYISLKKSVVQK